MIDKIKTWADSPEGKDILKTTAYVGSGGIIGLIANKLVGKKGLGYDIAATVAGGLGGYGLKRLGDKEVTEQIKNDNQSRKDTELVRKVEEIRNKNQSSDESSDNSQDKLDPNYSLWNAIIDAFKLKKSGLTKEERDYILKHSSATDDAQVLRAKATADESYNNALNSLHNLWKYPVGFGIAGTGAGGFIDFRRALKRHKGETKLGSLQSMLGESVYKALPGELGSPVIDRINNLPEQELQDAINYFNRKGRGHAIPQYLLRQGTPRENKQLAEGLEDVLNNRNQRRAELTSQINQAIQDKNNYTKPTSYTDAQNALNHAEVVRNDAVVRRDSDLAKYRAAVAAQDASSAKQLWRYLNNSEKSLNNADIALQSATSRFNKQQSIVDKAQADLDLKVNQATKALDDFNLSVNKPTQKGIGIKLGNTLRGNINPSLEKPLVLIHKKFLYLNRSV